MLVPEKLLQKNSSEGVPCGAGTNNYLEKNHSKKDLTDGWLGQIIIIESESEVTQWCLTLCDPVDCSPPGSPIPGILQARTLEWVAISFSNA